MHLFALYEIETGSQRFTLTVHEGADQVSVARYWNQPRRPGRRPNATLVSGASPACQQWSGEVRGPNTDAAMHAARREIEGIDGPIRHCTRSSLYGCDAEDGESTRAA